MPLTPTQTKALLDEMGHRPDKRLGQNFLVDGNLVRKSIQMAALPAGSTVVEVGPGLGALTGALLGAGHRVYAVERDPVLVKHLRVYHAEALQKEQLGLFGEDAVDFPLARLPADQEDFHIVAMLQKEAALRYQAEASTKNYGALTIFLAAAYEVAAQHPVSRTCFYPKPEVDSVLLRLDRKEEPRPLPKKQRELIRRLFTRRRKQIGGLAKTEDPATRAALETWLADRKLSPTLRPEQIPPQAWLSLDLS